MFFSALSMTCFYLSRSLSCHFLTLCCTHLPFRSLFTLLLHLNAGLPLFFLQLSSVPTLSLSLFLFILSTCPAHRSLPQLPSASGVSSFRSQLVIVSHRFALHILRIQLFCATCNTFKVLGLPLLSTGSSELDLLIVWNHLESCSSCLPRLMSLVYPGLYSTKTPWRPTAAS